MNCLRALALVPDVPIPDPKARCLDRVQRINAMAIVLILLISTLLIAMACAEKVSPWAGIGLLTALVPCSLLCCALPHN